MNVPIFISASFSFLSTVVTAVLTYHLGWVYTVLSPHDRHMVSLKKSSQRRLLKLNKKLYVSRIIFSDIRIKLIKSFNNLLAAYKVY